MGSEWVDPKWNLNNSQRNRELEKSEEKTKYISDRTPYQMNRGVSTSVLISITKNMDNTRHENEKTAEGSRYYAIAIHGGAGTIPKPINWDEILEKLNYTQEAAAAASDPRIKAYLDALSNTLRAAKEFLAQGNS